MTHRDRSDRSECLMNNKEGSSTPLNGIEPSGKRTSSVDMTVLIRSIQRVEGNSDCFRTARENCPEMRCCWRPYCVEGNPI
jgi:hypothetical protein